MSYDDSNGVLEGSRLNAKGERGWFTVAALMFGVGWGANQFASLLLAYRQHLGLTVGTDQALFGIYALGLVPALLFGGPASDRWGRSRVVRPAGVLSVIATLVLVVDSRSTAALYCGRFLAGVASGAVFAAGTAWVKELSCAPFDLVAREYSGARRATIALSLGFGLGPLVAGLIAEWAPSPLIVSYLPHLAIMAVVLPRVWRVPETVKTTSSMSERFLSRFRVPSARHLRFVTVVIPLAPWVFSAPTVAFAVLPTVVSDHTKGFGIAFAGLIAGLTLGIGVLVQPIARRLDRVDDARGVSVGLSAIIVGMVVAAFAASSQDWLLVLIAAGLLGAGYGICLVSGLLEVQRLAQPNDLASLTAVFYALTYVGFAVPLVLAELIRFTSYAVLLLILSGMALVSLLVVCVQSRRYPADQLGRPEPKIP